MSSLADGQAVLRLHIAILLRQHTAVLVRPLIRASNAGLTVKQVSQEDQEQLDLVQKVLDLVQKVPYIADYFFTPCADGQVEGAGT